MQRAFFLPPTMAKDAYYFLTPLAALVFLCFWAGFLWVAIALFVLCLFVVYFFRDPERSIPEDPRAIVSPADGKVVRLLQKGEDTILSIFLSLLDVHINRAPLEGTIIKQDYRPGKFLLAYDDRASVENEHMTITIAGKQKLTFSLIAGMLARRIRVWSQEGAHVQKGDKIGLIRFGSRVDITLPPECEVVVHKGDRVYGGSSIIAYWKESS